MFGFEEALELSISQGFGPLNLLNGDEDEEVGPQRFLKEFFPGY